jgi:hypothetical protein
MPVMLAVKQAENAAPTPDIDLAEQFAQFADDAADYAAASFNASAEVWLRS